MAIMLNFDEHNNKKFWISPHGHLSVCLSVCHRILQWTINRLYLFCSYAIFVDYKKKNNDNT